LQRGFICTGFQEDDPKPCELQGKVKIRSELLWNSVKKVSHNFLLGGNPIVKLPDDWMVHNIDVVSFRYVHPTLASKPDEEEFYFKMIPTGDHKLEINALSSVRNDEIANCEIK
jgi:PI31 proteasome regulator N-terminal